MEVQYPTDEYLSDEPSSAIFFRGDGDSLLSVGVEVDTTTPFAPWKPRPPEPATTTSSNDDSTSDDYSYQNNDIERQRDMPTINENYHNDDEEMEEKENANCCTSCLQGKRTKALYTSADWWSLWIGLLTFAGAFVLVYAVPFEKDSLRARFVVPAPMPWVSNPLDAWDLYNVAGGSLLVFVFYWFLYYLSLHFMGKLKAEKSVWQYVAGFSVMAFLAILAKWLGANEWCRRNGIGYAVFAIIIGMIVGNTCAPAWLLKTAGDGEFFIKCSLVLLAVQYNVIASVGGPAIAISWIGSPLAVGLSFITIRAVLGMDARLAVLVSMGSAWCGASAISAVAPIVAAKSEDVSLTISVVAFFTVAFTFIQPYIAMGAGMDDKVAGAWIGASVDQTGNVIASGTIISEEALAIASIVKMVLNAGLGFMASFIGCWWNYYVPRYLEEDVGERKAFSILQLWDKFPKFVVGFLITSAILTIYMQSYGDTVQASALPRAITTFNRWWFAIAFVGIGITTNIKKLYYSARESGIVWAYLIANTIDIFLALGLAYAFF